MKNQSSRREFLQRTSIAALGFWIGNNAAFGKGRSPNGKLNIGIIGTANRAKSNIAGVEAENIVALCDVDDISLVVSKDRFPNARIYSDYRKLLEQSDIDAVVISTPDHSHAPATAMALRAGKHVYCEKPLTHTVHEARHIARLAASHGKLATQLGTQIHAGANYRRAVELVQSGAIGEVTECHVWCDRTWSGHDRPVEQPPVPENLHWDLWLGPAPSRPYHPEYHPKNWRRWWDFGGGTLGDMACHYMDLAFWALKLQYPATIEAQGPEVKAETTPAWLIVNYEFPRRGGKSPLRLAWYDGGKRPELVTQGKAADWRNGVLFVGETGMLLADYGRHKLLPEEKFAGFQPPRQHLPDSLGHHAEWIRACKTGSPTTCNFAYSSLLTESVLLGNVAFRTGHKLEWDGPKLQVKNNPQARNYLEKEYRKGWRL